MYALRSLREERGYSQKDIAAALNVAPSTYNQWETGKREPDNATLLRIADFFHVSTVYLLGHNVPAEPQKEKPVPKDELSDDERDLLRLFRQLNAEAQARLLDTADDMVRSGKYAPKNNAAVMAAEEVSQ